MSDVSKKKMETIFLKLEQHQQQTILFKNIGKLISCTTKFCSLHCERKVSTRGQLSQLCTYARSLHWCFIIGAREKEQECAVVRT